VAGQRYEGLDEKGNRVALGARDEPGLRPTDALLLALASCSAYDVVEIARKQRAMLRRLVVRVAGERDEAPPRPFRRIHLRYEAAAEGLSEAKLRRAADLALNKYCAVRASLAPQIEVTFEVALERLDGEGPGEGDPEGTLPPLKPHRMDLGCCR
jgi:putative redox protein